MGMRDAPNFVRTYVLVKAIAQAPGRGRYEFQNKWVPESEADTQGRIIFFSQLQYKLL